MKSFFRLLASSLTLFAAATIIGAAATGAHADAGKKIPAAPYYYVLDEPGVLNAQTTRAIQTLLVEHDHLTGEQVLVAIFKGLDGEDVVDFTNRVFSEWKIGQRGKDNGVLLAVYWNDHQARIEVGYGLEPTLTDAKSKLILSDILLPELKNNQPDRALSLATLEILRTIGSPLIQNGKAERIFRSGGFQGDFRASAFAANAGSSGHVGAWPWMGFGFIFLMIVLNFFQSAEAHFSRAGLYQPSASEYYRIRRRAGRGGSWWGGFGGGGLGGGGFGGSGGGGFGGGGFSGGGGSSGGGGASGSW
jgi:uncharacterized protein